MTRKKQSSRLLCFLTAISVAFLCYFISPCLRHAVQMFLQRSPVIIFKAGLSPAVPAWLQPFPIPHSPRQRAGSLLAFTKFRNHAAWRRFWHPFWL